MPTITLDITGHNNQPVPHEFIRQDGEANRLAIFLPCFAYSCDMPIFYYAETLFLAAGADLLRTEYVHNRDPDFRALAPGVRLTRLLADAAPAVGAARAQRSYTAVSTVAKSLGTVTLAHLLERREHSDTTTAIWLTPVLSDNLVLETIRAHGGLQWVVIGESNPDYGADLIGTLAGKPGLRVLTIPQADHSLEIASIEALSATITAISSLVAAG